MNSTDNGIKRICVSVSELEQSRNFFVNELELTEVTRGYMDSATVEALYGIKNSDANYVMLKNDVQPTLLHLMEFSNTPKKEIRKDRPSWDFGYYDIAFRTKNNAAALKYFKEKQFTYYCEPVRYVADWINLDVLEGVLKGPDSVPLAMIERLKEPIPQFEGNFSIFTDTAVTLNDPDETVRFYEDVLGLTKIFDEDLPDGLVDDVVSVPHGTHTRMLMFSGGNTPITECLIYSKKGAPMSDIAKPENVGIFAMAYERDNLQETLKHAESCGFSKISDPVEAELLPYGKVQVVHIAGPSGVLVELFQRL